MMAMTVRHLALRSAALVLYLLAAVAMLAAVGLVVSVLGILPAPFVALLGVVFFLLARRIGHADRASR